MAGPCGSRGDFLNNPTLPPQAPKAETLA